MVNSCTSKTYCILSEVVLPIPASAGEYQRSVLCASRIRDNTVQDILFLIPQRTITGFSFPITMSLPVPESPCIIQALKSTLRYLRQAQQLQRNGPDTPISVGSKRPRDDCSGTESDPGIDPKYIRRGYEADQDSGDAYSTVSGDISDSEDCSSDDKDEKTSDYEETEEESEDEKVTDETTDSDGIYEKEDDEKQTEEIDQNELNPAFRMGAAFVAGKAEEGYLGDDEAYPNDDDNLDYLMENFRKMKSVTSKEERWRMIWRRRWYQI